MKLPAIMTSIFMVLVMNTTATARTTQLAYLKKGMVITCPLTHKKVYKVVKTVREGHLVKFEDIVFYGTNKHPKYLDDPKCNSVVTMFSGGCVHTNSGWLPKFCQKVLQINFTIKALIQ